MRVYSDYPQGYKVPHKNAPLKEKPLKDKAYINWLHNNNLTCMCCGGYNIEIHHLNAGLGARNDDEVVILCPTHHRGRFSPHGFDSDLFYAQYPKEELLEVARGLRADYLIERGI